MRPRKALRTYQLRAIDWIKDLKKVGLFIPMGLGKTASILTAFLDLRSKGECRAMLVVAPLKVAEGVWRQELDEWEHLYDLKAILVRGKPYEREALLRQDADIYVINFDALKWFYQLLYSMMERGFKPKFDFLAIDESSQVKNPSSVRFRILKVLLPLMRYVVIATGTPRSTSALELWSQLYLVDEGARLGGDFKRFRTRYFELVDISDGEAYGPGTMRYFPRKGAEESIYRKIGDVVLSFKQEDWLQLPPVVTTPVRVTLPHAARQIYDEFEREMFVQLEEAQLEAFNTASLTIRCHQLANGAIYADEAHTTIQEIHEAKLDALEQIIETSGDMPILVAYGFIHDLQRLRHRFGSKVPNLGGGQTRSTDDILKAWNAGDERLLFIHPKSASHGLNMQHGGNIIVWFSLTWSWELYSQFIARLARSGQKAANVLNYQLIAEDTVDEAIAAALLRRAASHHHLYNVLDEYKTIREMLA